MQQKSETGKKPARQSAAAILKNSFSALSIIHRAAFFTAAMTQKLPKAKRRAAYELLEKNL